MAAEHPIFGDIGRGDLAAVKQHVLADPAVPEEKHDTFQMTPLICTIVFQPCKPAIAQWLIDHRGQHDVNTKGPGQMNALHWACHCGPLSIVQALVASGADPLMTDWKRITPLMTASAQGQSDIVDYLLRLPAVRATVETVDEDGRTAVCHASRDSSASCVQLLLDAGADPTIPVGDESPLHAALTQGHTAIATLLRHAIAEPNRARSLHKARSLLNAAIVINKTRQDAHDGDDAVQQQKAIAAAPVYLKGRVERDEALPVPELTSHQGNERLRATAAFVLGLEEGGVQYVGLPRELYKELLGYLMYAWADKGLEAVAEEE